MGITTQRFPIGQYGTYTFRGGACVATTNPFFCYGAVNRWDIQQLRVNYRQLQLIEIGMIRKKKRDMHDLRLCTPWTTDDRMFTQVTSKYSPEGYPFPTLFRILISLLEI